MHNGTYDDVVEKCKNYIADNNIQRDEEEISVNDLISTSSLQGAEEGNNQEEEKEKIERAAPLTFKVKKCPSTIQAE